MKKMFRIAMMAVMLFVCSSINAQEGTSETYSFNKFATLPTGAWSIDQKLEGVEVVRRRANLTLTFAQGDGKNAPEYITSSTNKGEDINVVSLLPGNTMTLTSEKNNITQIQFFYTTKGKSAYGKNYEMTEGAYPDEKAYTYIWTGKTQVFQLKNLNNKGGIEIYKIVVNYEPAEQ